MTLADRILEARKKEEVLSEYLMRGFNENELRHWVREYFDRHQVYTHGLKFDYTNLCLSWLVENNLHDYMHLLEIRELYDGMREAWSIAQQRGIVIPDYLNQWMASTIAPNHKPPKYKTGRPSSDLFHHVICQCISKAARFTNFKASRNDATDTVSICDIVAEEIELDFSTVKRIWVTRDKTVFPK